VTTPTSNISRYIAFFVKHEPPFGGTFPFLVKGAFKGLVLHMLEERPMHGYEIMKILEERYHGFYKPSPGAIYPALRALVRQGLADVSGEERKKTYRISGRGRKFLKSQRAEIDKRFRAFESAVGPERAALFRELRETGRLMKANMRSVTPRQARELRNVLIQMRARMMKILAK